jgi:hypothetical protein
MRPSFPRLIRIIPKTDITPAIENVKSTFKPKFEPTILPPPLTPRDEAPTRVTLMQTLLQRKEDGLAKEEKGELAKGAGWPINLRVERPITKKIMRKVDEVARKNLKEIMKET